MISHSSSDHLVFTMNFSKGFVSQIVYVDDIYISGSDCTNNQLTKDFLRSQFVTKDLGLVSYFLAIETTCVDFGYVLSQRKYVLDLLEETNML